MFRLGELLEQARQMQTHIQKALDDILVEYTLPGGEIRVVMNGYKIPQLIEIQPDLMTPERKNELETLLVMALQSAIKRVEKEVQDKIGNILPPGMSLPGFNSSS